MAKSDDPALGATPCRGKTRVGRALRRTKHTTGALLSLNSDVTKQMEIKIY